MYKTVARYVASCDVCQTVKPSPSIRAPTQSLQVPEDVWSSVSIDYITYLEIVEVIRVFGRVSTVHPSFWWLYL